MTAAERLGEAGAALAAAGRAAFSDAHAMVLLTAAAPGLPAGTYSLVITSTGLL